MTKGNNTSKEEDLQWKDELKISMWNISASTDLMIYFVNFLFSSVLVHFWFIFSDNYGCLQGEIIVHSQFLHIAYPKICNVVC